MVGTVIGNFQIVEKIGEGGMGSVYKGIDLTLERTVAIKILRSELTDDSNIVERFRREAKSLARLNHPNINNVYNFLNHNNEYLIVLEYIDGENLEQRLAREGKISYESAYKILIQITSALSFAHHRGIVHRDIKPANIMETVDGNVKVTDFGIARVLGATALTQLGKAPGSVYYASPEQIRAEENLDARSDIYSLGILLFQLLTGALPFRGASLPEILHKQLETPPPLISGYLPAVSPVVEAVIKKALAKKPEDRFSTVEEFLGALPAVAKSDKIFAPTDFSQPAPANPVAVTPPRMTPSQPVIADPPPKPRIKQPPVIKLIPNHIRLTDTRFTVNLEPSQQPENEKGKTLLSGKPPSKKSKFRRIIVVGGILLFVGISALAVFYFVVQPNLHSFR